MVTSSDLIKLIKDKENNFTEEELKKILDAELMKDESEIDTDLVECCLQALEDGKKPMPAKKEKKKTLKFIFFAGAAAALIFVNIIAFSDFGKKDNTNQVIHITSPNATTPVKPSQTIVVEEVTDIKGAPTTNPDGNADSLGLSLKSQLENAGFTDVSLPAEVIKAGEAAININGDTVTFSSIVNEQSINIVIAKNQPAPSMKAPEGAESQTINSNGISALVTSEDGVSVITYRKNSLNYQIITTVSLEEAAEIAKTIR